MFRQPIHLSSNFDRRWEPRGSFDGDIVDRFWARVDVGLRDKDNLGQWDIGEEVFPTGPPRMSAWLDRHLNNKISDPP